jgi:acyl-CoA synthetase (AMP-forming)/AMP-acid ligase II
MRAEQQPDKFAYTFVDAEGIDQARLTYAELDERARKVAAALQSLTDPGERVLLLYPPGLDYITAFFGCLYAGGGRRSRLPSQTQEESVAVTINHQRLASDGGTDGGPPLRQDEAAIIGGFPSNKTAVAVYGRGARGRPERLAAVRSPAR